MMQKHRSLYIQPSTTSGMERKPISNTGMPIENLPIGLRPSNIGPGQRTCTTCGVRTTRPINISGCHGGNEYVCMPCYTNFGGDDGQPLGKNTQLNCGCIISTVEYEFIGNDSTIHLCPRHLITLTPMIVTEQLVDDGYRNCSSCGELQLENEFTIMGKAGPQTKILCKICYSDFYCIGCGEQLDKPRIDNGCLVCMGGA